MSVLSSLSAYFERIQYWGPHCPTLATLDGIVSHHVSRIPFENLDVLLGRGISIELGRIEQKLVAERRGGYCFEQNTLLCAVLEALGFDVTPLSARVRVQRTREFTPARTHLCLRVVIDAEAFLVDVGVGGFSLASALRLVPDVIQQTPHEPRRLVREGLWDGLALRAPDARLFHQVYFADVWHDVYEFTLEPMPVIDREVSNWYTSTHPDSHFRSRLVAARATEGGRITLVNRELTLRYNDRPAESRLLSSNAELLATLDQHFGLLLPKATRFNVSELAALP